MDIKQYADRLRIKQLPEGFNHQNGVNYDSSWDYVKAELSNYHYDKFASWFFSI
jgi:hypothetical protein